MPMLRPAAMFEPGASTTTSGSSPCSRASASSSSVPSLEPPSTTTTSSGGCVCAASALEQLGELVAVVPDGDHDGDAVLDRGSRAIAVQIGLTSGGVGHAGLYAGHSPIVFGAWLTTSPVIGHLVRQFLPLTETFVAEPLRHLQRVRPVVVAGTVLPDSWHEWDDLEDLEARYGPAWRRVTRELSRVKVLSPPAARALRGGDPRAPDRARARALRRPRRVLRAGRPARRADGRLVLRLRRHLVPAQGPRLRHARAAAAVPPRRRPARAERGHAPRPDRARRRSRAGRGPPPRRLARALPVRAPRAGRRRAAAAVRRPPGREEGDLRPARGDPRPPRRAPRRPRQRRARGPGARRRRAPTCASAAPSRRPRSPPPWPPPTSSSRRARSRPPATRRARPPSSSRRWRAACRCSPPATPASPRWSRTAARACSSPRETSPPSPARSAPPRTPPSGGRPGPPPRGRRSSASSTR